METSCNQTTDPLRVVPSTLGFHFYTAVGHSCGITSTSLEEFVNALQYLCAESIMFHFDRGDFQNWIRDVIGDAELAMRLDEIKMCARQLDADCCRRELVETIRIRILQLEVAKGPPCFGKRNEKT